MFGRRNKPHIRHRVQNVFWPTIGWRRWGHYMRHRIGRLPGTPYSIAAGFAYGAAISFSPFMGLHIALSAGLAWMTRASMIAAAIGTLVGNPWTFPFIWVWTYELGNLMLGSAAHPLNFSMFLHMTLHQSFTFLKGNFWSIFLPMLLGSIPSGIVVWGVFYFPMRNLIARYQHQRLQRQLRRSGKLASKERAVQVPDVHNDEGQKA